MGDRRPRLRVHRLAPADLMQWQADVGPVPHHVGALLVLGPDGPPVSELCAVLVSRLGRVPALRRRPVRPGPGGGSWYWLEDDADARSHLTVATVPDAGVEGLLDAATGALTTRTTPGRSPWSVTVLADRRRAAVAVVLVLHHVLADGVSGPAALGLLADGPAAPGRPWTAGTAPRSGVLVRDAWGRRLAALRRARPWHALPALRTARAELGHGDAAPRTVLNRPTGAQRRTDLVDVDEAGVRAAARALSASVNDLVLVAAVEALRAAAAEQGEDVGHLVVAVPVAVGPDDAADDATDGARNAVGVMQLAVPATGPLAERVRLVTGRRTQRLAGRHGRSLPLVLLGFRVVRTLHLTRWFLDRQWLVNTLVTAVPALPGPMSLAGTQVVTVVPLVVDQGNTTASFATVRYGGRLTVGVTTDPEHGPDGATLARRLGEALAGLTPVQRDRQRP